MLVGSIRPDASTVAAPPPSGTFCTVPIETPKLFVQYTPFTALTDEALIWATRLPTSQIHVSSSAFLDVANA